MGVTIDPDGVIAMSLTTVSASLSLSRIGGEISTEIEKVDQWVPGAPHARSRASSMAEELAMLAGAAKTRATDYVDHDKPIEDLRKAGYYLPDWGKFAPDKGQGAASFLHELVRSDEFGALPLGTSQALLERYRNFKAYVPKSDVVTAKGAIDEITKLLASSDDVVAGTRVVKHPSGLYVPQGSSADPRVPRANALIDDAYYKPGPRLATDPSYLKPPTWAKYGGKGLGAAGAALTLYDAGVSQWEHDQKYHPEYSDNQRKASAGYAVVTEGGGAVAGGLVGAHYGAVAGSFIPIPVVGTVGGALIGGAIGAFVGSKFGKAAGTVIKEGAKKVWNKLFG